MCSQRAGSKIHCISNCSLKLSIQWTLRSFITYLKYKTYWRIRPLELADSFATIFLIRHAIKRYNCIFRLAKNPDLPGSPKSASELLLPYSLSCAHVCERIQFCIILAALCLAIPPASSSLPLLPLLPLLNGNYTNEAAGVTHWVTAGHEAKNRGRGLLCVNSPSSCSVQTNGA